MSEKQFYTAIDLGTTNSVISYGNIVNDKIKPIVLELDRKNDTGSTSRNPLLPSVVFYYKNNDGIMVTDVGDYAKSRYGTRAGYVCKSVKSLMGVSDQVPLVDEIEDKTPSDVSAQILSYMVNSAKKRLFQKELKDVVITVPASFDSDQCQATIDAARRAGLNVENEHDILLYEPKAVIYDFMRMQEAGEIPSNLLSLETEKNVMVFDLGGGTLDVTIHRVGCTQEGLYNIRDLAISRYTLLGGDNFDILLADDMLKRFEEMYGIKVSIKRREEVMCKLIKLAEHLKMELSMAYENARMSDFDLPDEYEFEEMDVNLYDSYAFECTYTKKEVEEIVAPLMGYSFKRSDVSRIHNLGEKDVDNIIYPILDVLDKAGADIRIDAVLLNGGMTKFYLIRERLKEFFGFEPLATSDPDLAVSRGAVYYHYCLHKYHIKKMDAAEALSNMGDGTGAQSEHEIGNRGENRMEDTGERKVLFHTGTILNDSINLGLRGEYVSLLIPAGTELPYRSEEIRDQYKLEKSTNSIGIELFLGRGTTKNLPNRRIATRVVEFPNTYPANTPISFQIYINSMRMMTMEAWITDRPNTKTIMEMDMASLKAARKTTKGIGTVGKMKLNAKSEINELKNLADRNKSRPNFELNDRIASMIQNIGQASNPEDFFEPCYAILQSCRQSDVMMGYIYMIGMSFQDGWNEDQKRKMLRFAKRHFEEFSLSVQQNGYVLRRAMQLIAVFDPGFLDFYTDYLTRQPGENSQSKQVMFQFAIKNEADNDRLIPFLEKFFKVSDLNKWIAQELIHRFGRGTEKTDQKKLAKIVRNLVTGLNAQERERIPKYLPVVVAELCSNDRENPLREDKYTIKPAWQALQKYLEEEPYAVFASAITNIYNGIDLTEEETRAVEGALIQP